MSDKPIEKPKNEDEWLQLITKQINESGEDYIATWWVRLSTGIPTVTLNYHLSKLSNKGLLRKETNRCCTKFFLSK